MNSKLLENILNGQNPRILIEGYFSDLNLELNEKLDDLLKLLGNSDFEFGNQLNPNYSKINETLKEIFTQLDKFGANATNKTNQYLSTHSQITCKELIDWIRKEFL